MTVDINETPDLTPEQAAMLYEVYWGVLTIALAGDDIRVVRQLVKLGLLEIDSNGIISTTPAGELAYEAYHGDPDEVLSAMW